MAKSKSSRSGGIDVDAEKVDIGDDVVGRDKIVNPVYQYNNNAPQRRRAELPNQPYFFGREDELAKIKDALDPESNGWGVLIDGPGGIGKTALAIRAGHLASNETYPTKIFLSAKIRELTPQGEQELQDSMLPNFMALITELAKELGEEDIEKTDPNERVKEARRALEDSHALIIVDNLETFSDNERDRVFQFLKRLPHSCKVIVTSRRRTDVAAEIIRLDRLKQEDAMKLITKLSERNKLLAATSDKERQDLYGVTEGNPSLIEWMAGQLGRKGSHCRTIDEACEYLKSAPNDNDPLEFIFGDLLDTFTDHETAVLAALSYFVQPAKIKWIADIAGITESAARTALEDLTERSIAFDDSRGEFYGLPPLTAVFLRRKRPEFIAETSGRLADYVSALVYENGLRNYELFNILEAEWPTIDAAMPLLLQEYNNQLVSLINYLQYFLEFSGRWDERIYYDQRAEILAIQSQDRRWAGWRVYKTGWLFYLRKQINELVACVSRLDIYWADAGTYERAYGARLRGLRLEVEINYSAAIVEYQKAIRLWRTLGLESNEVSLGLNDLGRIESLMEDYDAAKRDYREALRIAKKVGSPSDAQASITGSLAMIENACGNWFAAEDLAREAVALSEKVGRLELIASSCYQLAKSICQQGRKAEGLKPAQRAVEILTKLRSPDLEKAQAVLRECKE